MSRQGKTPEQLNGMAHRHYQEWHVGNAVQTEFFLQHTVLRHDDIAVTINGVRQRPSDKGTANDYSIRGVTPGYNGDSNAVRFAAAPTLNADIVFDVVSS